MKLLENKVAIIIGASSGIGRTTARLFAAHGAAVVINARGKKALDKVAAEIREAGGPVHTVAGDAG
ncbi:SDR family NAD(P)-dependent oxidoreductase, partial [Rhizobium phaseoli]|uniref:SDR family NAD(P)-dependent oxidoreductase n=1 Tax=Rhizobium phaseoli TaxID=396 RepID=UPI00143830FF